MVFILGKRIVKRLGLGLGLEELGNGIRGGVGAAGRSTYGMFENNLQLTTGKRKENLCEFLFTWLLHRLRLSPIT